MALTAGMVLEFRATGTATGGGGFNGTRGTAQLSLTDLAASKGSTTVTSATGGFSAGMVGCCLVITGGVDTNAVLGQYLITGYTSTNQIAIAHTCAIAGAMTAGVGTVSEGKDYSQQDAPQLALTDLAVTATSTTATSATAGFTAAMVGSLCYIAGTNLTTSWYEITAVTDASTVTLDRSPCPTTNATGGTCNVGGAVSNPTSTLLDTLLELLKPGCVAWWCGTFTLAGTLSVSTGIGTLASTIRYDGYGTTRGDRPTGTNRPQLVAAAQSCSLPSFLYLNHFRTSSTATAGVTIGEGSACTNCQFVNTSTSANRTGATIGKYNLLISCEFQSYYGYAAASAADASTYLWCWFHDSNAGAYLAYGGSLHGCLIENCTTGIASGAGGGTRLYLDGCTIVCGKWGISVPSGTCPVLVTNCVFAYQTVAGILAAVLGSAHIGMGNTFHSCTAQTTAIDRRLDEYLATDPAMQGTRTWTDLACSDHSGPPFDVTSATGGLATYLQAGDYIYITGAGNWVPGVYRVDAVSSGTLSLHTDPTNGSNATNGTAVTIRVSPGVADCRLGAGNALRTAGRGLTMGVGV